AGAAQARGAGPRGRDPGRRPASRPGVTEGRARRHRDRAVADRVRRALGTGAAPGAGGIAGCADRVGLGPGAGGSLEHRRRVHQAPPAQNRRAVRAPLAGDRERCRLPPAHDGRPVSRIPVAAAFAVTMAIVLGWAAYLLYVDVGKELTEAVDRELQVRAHDLTLVV